MSDSYPMLLALPYCFKLFGSSNRPLEATLRDTYIPLFVTTVEDYRVLMRLFSASNISEPPQGPIDRLSWH